MGNLGFHLVVLAALEGTCMATFSVPSEVSDGETSTPEGLVLPSQKRNNQQQQ